MGKLPIGKETEKGYHKDDKLKYWLKFIDSNGHHKSSH